MEKERVLLKERDVYGILKFYPHNDVAKKFCEIAGTKTMTLATIAIIKSMGYEVFTGRIAFYKEPTPEEVKNDTV